MDGQERIIRKLFTEKMCYRCGRGYEPASILVLARRSDVWMVMISCTGCEQKDTYVVKFPPQLQGRRHVTSYRISKPPASTPLPPQTAEPSLTLSDITETPPLSQPVSADDVLNMHLFLKDFNGDFQQLFSEVE